MTTPTIAEALEALRELAHTIDAGDTISNHDRIDTAYAALEAAAREQAELGQAWDVGYGEGRHDARLGIGKLSVSVHKNPYKAT